MGSTFLTTNRSSDGRSRLLILVINSSLFPDSLLNNIFSIPSTTAMDSPRDEPFSSRKSSLKVKVFFGTFNKQKKPFLASSSPSAQDPLDLSLSPSPASSHHKAQKPDAYAKTPLNQPPISWKVTISRKLTSKLSRPKPVQSFSYTPRPDDADTTTFGTPRASVLDFHGLPPLHSFDPTLSIEEIDDIVNLLCHSENAVQSPTFMKYSQQPLEIVPSIAGVDQNPINSTVEPNILQDKTNIKTEKPPVKYSDIHKLHTGSTHGSSELYRRYSDGFRSNKRRISRTSSITEEQQHPWCRLKSESRTSLTSLSTPIEEGNTTKKSPGSFNSSPVYNSPRQGLVGKVPRHPELLHSSWQNVTCIDDPVHVYQLANEIANYRVKERHTIVQLRRQQERNKARWAFESIPRVHIKRPAGVSGTSPSRRQSQTSPTSGLSRHASYRRNLHRLNTQSAISTSSNPHPVYGSDNITTNNNTSNSMYPKHSTSPSYISMQTACSLYVNKVMQGDGTVLPRGQFMAKLIMIRTQPKRFDLPNGSQQQQQLPYQQHLSTHAGRRAFQDRCWDSPYPFGAGAGYASSSYQSPFDLDLDLAIQGMAFQSKKREKAAQKKIRTGGMHPLRQEVLR